MFVTTTFLSATAIPKLWIPSEAVIATGARSVVIRQSGGGSFDAVNVTPGAVVDDQTEILSGLAEGEAIVLSGQFLIDSEANLKSSVNRLSASTPATADAAP
jgi:Cu(I)/Ag(I) efflux system membrane fusion protein